VFRIETSVGHLLHGIYGGIIENPPPVPCVAQRQVTCVAEGSPDGNLATAAISLDRVTARRADLHLLVWFQPSCFPTSPNFSIDRDNAQALGDKTGNGGRAATACID